MRFTIFRLFPAILALTASSVLANPILISGVLIDDDLAPTPPFMYRAVEFYVTENIGASEISKYAVRILYDADSGSPNPGTGVSDNPNILFDGFSGVSSLSAGSFFYITPNEGNFEQLYDASGGPGGADWEGNSGVSSPLYASGGNLFAADGTDGNEIWQLLYYPGGAFPGGAFTVVDTFGVINDPNAAGQTHAWNYEDSWAYRKNQTTAAGTVFNPNDWVLPGSGSLVGLSDAQVAATVPFGTFTIVPEPSTLALLGAGLLALLRHFRRGR